MADDRYTEITSGDSSITFVKFNMILSKNNEWIRTKKTEVLNVITQN